MLAAIVLAGALQSDAGALAEARSLIQSGQLSAAEHRTRTYLALSQNSAEAHYLLGYILFKEQKPEASLAEYTAGAKFRSPGALDFETIGADYVLLRDYSDADKWFTKSVELDPQNASALYYLGRTKYNENFFDQAVTAFTRCLKLEPNDVRAQDNLGLSYQGLGSPKRRKALSAQRSPHKSRRFKVSPGRS